MAKTSQLSTAQLLESADRHLYPNYGKRSVVLERGRGATLWDTDGRKYVDFYAGIAVSTIGHAHPKLVEAIHQQAARLLHQSNYYLSEPNVRLAARLCESSGLDRAFFCNSGTEANEAALKLVRRHFYDAGLERRYRVLSFEGSFHGRTLGALAVTGQSKYSSGFGPLSGACHVPFGDLEAVARELTDDVAAIIVEPIQGEGGVVPTPTGFLRGLRDLCNRSGTWLVLDEIQTGMGRTGRLFAFEHSEVRPDVLTLAKGLGGGVPVGAMLCVEQLAASLPPGSHGTTFGGNPLASAAALATLDVIAEEGLVARAATLGARLSERLEELCNANEHVLAVRGLGLMQALVLDQKVPAQGMVAKLRDAGVLLTAAGGNALRFTPPLNVTDEELDEGLSIVSRVLSEEAP